MDTSNMAGAQDLGPKLNAVVWILLGSSGIFLALRLYCKFLKNRGFWWDDHVLVASWVRDVVDSHQEKVDTQRLTVSQIALMVNVICISVSISLGFGHHVSAIDPNHLTTIQILGNVCASSAIMAAVWSKTSFAITLLRITDGKIKPVVWFVIVSMNLLMGVHALMPWIQCNPVSKTWNRDEPGTCWDPRVNIVYGIVAGCM